MNDHAWLRQVLDDAKAAKELWPEWAKESDEQTKLSQKSHGCGGIVRDTARGDDLSAGEVDQAV